MRRVEINLGNSAETQFTYTSVANLAANSMDSAEVLAAVPTEGVRKTEYDLLHSGPIQTASEHHTEPGHCAMTTSASSRDRRARQALRSAHLRRLLPSGQLFLQSRSQATWARVWRSPGRLRLCMTIRCFRAGYGLYYGEGQLGDLTGPLNNLTIAHGPLQLQSPTLSLSGRSVHSP